MTPELGAIFDPFGNAVHTALSFPLVGEDVLITGAGPIGLMAIAVARHAGAGRSPSRTSPRRGWNWLAGWAWTWPSMSQRRASRTPSVNWACAKASTSAWKCPATPRSAGNDREHEHGGRIAMLGLPSQSITIDWGKVVTHMLTMKGIYGREMFETWYAMSAMLSSNPVLHANISAVVTDTLPASDWEKGFEIARAGVGGKVVLDWTCF
ncbi:L-threonine 3-dehydrogenase [Arthrobacter sp. Hiyo6]|nr:L-threonine 3-dehydrogenase [Arthrobacter sp. Hiyo6]